MNIKKNMWLKIILKYLSEYLKEYFPDLSVPTNEIFDLKKKGKFSNLNYQQNKTKQNKIKQNKLS